MSMTKTSLVFQRLVFALLRDMEFTVESSLLANIRAQLEDYYGTHSPKEIIELHLIGLPKEGKKMDTWLSCGSQAAPGGADLPGLPGILWGILGGSTDTPWCTTQQHVPLDPNRVLFARSFCFFLKRWKVTAKEDAFEEAVDAFYKVEDELPPPLRYDPTLERMDDLGVVENGCDYATWRIYDRISRLFASHYGFIDPFSLRGRHGPGAVSDLPSSGDKYTFPYSSVTLEEALPVAFLINHRDPEGARAAYYEPYEDEWGPHPRVLDTPLSCKLLAVPKTYDKVRLIASEPVLHQFLQQGLMDVLRSGLHPILKKVINFKDQRPSQELALRGSTDSSLCTIDLASASDRLSLRVVEHYFSANPSLLTLLKATRSPVVTDSVTDRAPLEMRKFAAMGSAVTFPVQSIVYATMCLATHLAVKHPKCHLWEQDLLLAELEEAALSTQVFGDDIIVATTASELLVRNLEAFWLKVNRDKSHFDGYFRESCGMDAYLGYSVTPCYVSSMPSREPKPTLDDVALLEQSNNAFLSGFWNLAKEIEALLGDKFLRFVPIASDRVGSVSLVTFAPKIVNSRKGANGSAREVTLVRGRFRYKESTQQWEARSWILTNRATLRSRRTWRDLLQYYLEEKGDQEIIQGDRLGSYHATRIRLTSGWVPILTGKPERYPG